MSDALRQEPDVPVLLEILRRHGVRYTLFGSAGAQAYGADLSPGDLDICPALDEENLGRLAAALEEMGARPRYTPGWNTREECDAWRPYPPTEENLDHLFETRYGDFDVVPRPYGPRGKEDRFSYETLDESAVTIPFHGMEVRVAGAAQLVASKMSRQREKDLQAYPELQRILEEQSGG